MRIGTANLRNLPDMTPAQVADDTATIMEHTSLCGLQEIQPGEDTPVIRRKLGKGWHLVGGSYETPIVFKLARWELVDHRTLAFHRPSLPIRESIYGAVTSVLLRDLNHPHRPPFAVVNTHLVVGGYNGAKLPVVADRWRIEWGIYRDEAIRYWKRGHTVYLTGDLNNPRPPRIQPVTDWGWLTPSGPPDHIGQLRNPAGVHLGHHQHQAIALHSDHDLHVVSGPLWAPGES